MEVGLRLPEPGPGKQGGGEGEDVLVSNSDHRTTHCPAAPTQFSHVHIAGPNQGEGTQEEKKKRKKKGRNNERAESSDAQVATEKNF